MSDNNNPYSAPSSNLEQSTGSSGEVTLRPTPQKMPAGRGWGWISDGFGYFKRSPAGWILGAIVGFIIVLVLNLIPIVGQLIYYIIVYVLVGGIMLGCHAQSQGQPFQVKHVFAGFQQPTKLIILSVTVALISVLVALVTLGPTYLQMFTSNDPEVAAEVTASIMANPNGFILRILLGMLVYIPVSMAIWFAPALIAINDVSVVTALKKSFSGCLKNIVPFLLFGVIGLLLIIVGSIPLGLGLLVVMPMLTAASYVAYREIFTETAV